MRYGGTQGDELLRRFHRFGENSEKMSEKDPQRTPLGSKKDANSTSRTNGEVDW